MEPEVKAVAQEKAQARMADLLAAVDVDKYMKVCIESLRCPTTALAVRFDV